MQSHFLLSVFVVALLTIACESDNTLTTESSEPSSTLIFTDQDGNQLTTEDLEGATGSYNYALVGEDNATPEAKRLHDEGRLLGSSGDYEASNEKLLAAHAAAPAWPYPIYDLAYNYLLQGDNENALRYYEFVDSLAPQGFYTSKTAVHVLRKEADGSLPQGCYRMCTSLEWISDPAQKVELVNMLKDSIPDCALVWKEYAMVIDGPERLQALRHAQTLDCDMETYGILRLNEAAMLANADKTDEAKTILGNMILDPNTTPSNLELAKVVLKSFI